ncbi:unnamed protein product [Penicillium bialowiezense]
MANTTDVIVLSSSPNPSPTPAWKGQDELRTSDTSPQSATPTPAPLARAKPPTRSRFFPTPCAEDKNPEGTSRPRKRAAKKTAPLETNDQNLASKPQRKAKRSTNKSEETVLRDHSEKGIDPKDNEKKQTKAPVRKTTKTKGPANLTLAGKVTKTNGNPPPKTTTDTEPQSAENNTETLDPKKSNALGRDELLHLDEASRRRLDWTPPRETAGKEITSVGEGCSQDEHRVSTEVIGFGKLLSDYNYSGIAPDPRELVQTTNSEAPTKRRRIDLVDPVIQSLLNGKSDSTAQTAAQGQGVDGKSKKTTKSKPKKFSTLTARMTAQYTINDEDESDAPDEGTREIRTTKSRRSKAKEAVEESRYTILSPEAAVEFVNDQDLVFGTCSQLEREDSPQTLREMQQAIHASETLSYSEGLRDLIKSPATNSMQGQSNRSVSKLTGTRNLWCVASRNTDGSLVQPKAQNVIDLTERVESPQNNAENVDKALHKSLPDDWFELSFADLDSPSEKRTRPSNISEQSSAPTEQVQVSLSSQTLVPESALNVKPKSAKSAKSAKKAGPAPTLANEHRPVTHQVPSMPQYSGFTDAELSKQVATFGFKSVRGRKKMIELLQQCWESKHAANTTSDTGCINQTEREQSSTLQTLETSKSTSGSSQKSNTTTVPVATPLEPLTRTTTTTSESWSNTQKTPQRQVEDKQNTVKSTSYIDIEEIQDSEEEITPSPSRVQKHHSDSMSRTKTGKGVPERSLDILTKAPPPSPTKRKVVSSKTSITKKSSSASMKASRTVKSSENVCLADISSQITNAVRIQPRSSSLGSRIRPTWHEKILMYDPIVLEDFTAWLNTEGFGLVGEDCEVGTASVREWCESKGICCCWKKNASW